MKTSTSLTTTHFGCDRCRSVPQSNQSSPLQWVRQLLEDAHEGYILAQCHACGQNYLQHFKEIGQFQGEDDFWLRWVPLTSAEKAQIEELFPPDHEDWSKAHILNEHLHNRVRLVSSPDGSFYWTDDSLDACDLTHPGY